MEKELKIIDRFIESQKKDKKVYVLNADYFEKTLRSDMDAKTLYDNYKEEDIRNFVLSNIRAEISHLFEHWYKIEFSYNVNWKKMEAIVTEL